jgi:hypothetical protein
MRFNLLSGNLKEENLFIYLLKMLNILDIKRRSHN